MDLPVIFLVTLGLSWFFALAGLGAAGLLMPLLHWMGLPINAAKSAALLGNTVSLSAATWDNLRSHRIDWRLGLPIIASSILLAPLGAQLSTYVDREWILGLFAAFLAFAGVSALLPQPARPAGPDRRPRRPVLLLIGGVAGLLSGLLGIGGGGVIAAAMLRMGCDAKKIAVITALAVPFSSFSGFLAYAAGGHASWALLLTIASASLIGGLAGNKTGHRHLSVRTVKRIIGVVSLIFAAKILMDLFA